MKAFVLITNTFNMFILGWCSKFQLFAFISGFHFTAVKLRECVGAIAIR